MSFLGTYADLTGYHIGSFTVDGLIGRDKSGAPTYRVKCGQCWSHQGIGHARLAHLTQSKASQRSLCCNNPACPLSRHEHHSESLGDLRGQERKQAEQAAEAVRLARIEAEKQRAKAAQIAALKAEYRRYWNHQMRTNIEQSKIVKLERWQQLTEGTRRLIMDRISKDPTVYFEGL